MLDENTANLVDLALYGDLYCKKAKLKLHLMLKRSIVVITQLLMVHLDI